MHQISLIKQFNKLMSLTMASIMMMFSTFNIIKNILHVDVLDDISTSLHRNTFAEAYGSSCLYDYDYYASSNGYVNPQGSPTDRRNDFDTGFSTISMATADKKPFTLPFTYNVAGKNYNSAVLSSNVNQSIPNNTSSGSSWKTFGLEFDRSTAPIVGQSNFDTSMQTATTSLTQKNYRDGYFFDSNGLDYVPDQYSLQPTVKYKTFVNGSDKILGFSAKYKLDQINPVNESSLDVYARSGKTSVYHPIHSNTDYNIDNLSISSIITSPAHGTATIVGETIQYTPSSTYYGSDSLVYQISDGNGGFINGTINITVQNVLGRYNFYSVGQGEYDLPVLDDDLVSTNSSEYTVSIIQQPASFIGGGSAGTLSLNPNNTLHYNPLVSGSGYINDEFNGIADFKYTITHGATGENVTISKSFSAGGFGSGVSSNHLNQDLDRAVVDRAVVYGGTTNTINILQNDNIFDPLIANISLTQPVLGGSVVLNPDKTVSYTSTSSDSLQNNFTYTVTFVNGDTETVVVAILEISKTDYNVNSYYVENKNSTFTSVYYDNSDPDFKYDSVASVDVKGGGLDYYADIDNQSIAGDGSTKYVFIPKNCPFNPDSDLGATDQLTPVTVDVINNDDNDIEYLHSINSTNTSSNSNGNHISTAESKLTVTGILYPPTLGTAVVNPNGTITYTPNRSLITANTFDNFCYTVRDTAWSTLVTPNIQSACVDIEITFVPQIIEVDKKFQTASGEVDDLIGSNAVTVGSTITERIYYNNLSSTSAIDAQIQSQLPAGFTVTNLKNCLDPENTQTNTDDSCSANLPLVLVNGANELNVSPAAGLYDAVTPYTLGTPSGTAPTSSKGILDIGKKKYTNLASCNYYKSANNKFFQTYIDHNYLGSPSIYDANSSASNSPTSINCGSSSSTVVQYSPDPTWSQMNSYNITNRRYLNFHECVYYQSDIDGWFNSIGNSNNPTFPTQMDAGTNTSNTVDPSNICGSGNTASGGYQLNNTWSSKSTLQLLGNRYLNLHQCTYYRSAVDSWYTTMIDVTGTDYDAGSNTSNTSDTTSVCGVGGNAGQYVYNSDWSNVQSLDLLDQSRGRGYIEVKMTAPTTDAVYSQTAKLSAVGFSDSNDSAQIEVTLSSTQNADLSFVKTSSGGSSSSPSVEGQLVSKSTVTYTLTVTNNGPDSAGQPITVVDNLPPAIVYQSYSGVNWTCVESASVVTCTNPNALINGDSSQVQITGLVN